MAEAIVDGTPISRFFCHQCRVEIEDLLPDYKCPKCSSGFIEELERTTMDTGSSLEASNEDLSDSEVMAYREYLDPIGANTVFQRLDIALPSSASSNTNSENGRSTRSAIVQPHVRHSNRLRGRDTNLTNQMGEDSRNNSSGRNPQQEFNNLIQDFFINLSSIGLNFSQMQGGHGSVPTDIRLLFGNPGDYVWGREGLDSIVTQLLNQMDTSGPPPLSKKLIDEIPTMNVSQTQVDSKLQCSVCWEDFILSEPVRELSCQHYYHAPCIVPWLELHGTCPICRQSLGETDTVEANQDQVGPSIAALFRAAENDTSGIRTSSASSTSLESNSRNDSPNEI